MKQVFIIAFITIVFSAQAQQTWFSSNGVAINGYDPVAYHQDMKAVAGSPNFEYLWQGTKWRFKNSSNLETFKSNPEKYVPQFGGFCAYGVSQDHKSPTEPEAFTVLNGKLYLNYNAKVKELWKKDINGNIEKAEKNWPSLKDKN